MELSIDDDQIVLVIPKAELMVAKPEIVSGIWSACQLDDKIAQTVGRFMVLGLALMLEGVLQFINE